MTRAHLLAAMALALAPASALAQSSAADLESQQRPGLLRPDSLLGRDVLSEDGERIGTVADVTTEATAGAPDGTPRQLVIEGAGYPGMEGKRIAVDYGFTDLDVRGDWVVAKDVAAAEIAALPAMLDQQETISLRRDAPVDPSKLRNRP